MEPFDLWDILSDNWLLLIFVPILLGALYLLINYQSILRERVSQGEKKSKLLAVRENTMSALAEKLGLQFEPFDVTALGETVLAMQLFKHKAEIGQKVQSMADKWLGYTGNAAMPHVRFRNIAKGFVADSTICIFDHHYENGSPSVHQTVVLIQSCEINCPHLVIRAKTKTDSVTGIVTQSRMKLSENRAFQDWYVVETECDAYRDVIPPQLISELARAPYLWMEASGQYVAICKPGWSASLEECLMLLDMATQFKNSFKNLPFQTVPTYQSVVETEVDKKTSPPFPSLDEVNPANADWVAVDDSAS